MATTTDATLHWYEYPNAVFGDRTGAVWAFMLKIAAVSLAAADLPREGTYDFTVCFKRNQMQLDCFPSQSVWSYDQRGTAVSNMPGGLFDGDDVQCVGMSGLLDGKRFGNAACLSVPKDGSKRLTRNWYDGAALRKMQAAGGRVGPNN